MPYNVNIINLREFIMFITKWFAEKKAARIQKKRIKTVSKILREIAIWKPTSGPFQTFGLGLANLNKPAEEMTQYTIKFSTKNFHVSIDRLARVSMYKVTYQGESIFETVDQTTQYNGSLGLNDTEVFGEENVFAMFEHELIHVLAQYALSL